MLLGKCMFIAATHTVTILLSSCSLTHEHVPV